MRHLLWLLLALLLLGRFAAARAQVPYGLPPLPTVAGVPFHGNVFGGLATEAAAGKAASPRPTPGAPRDVYTGHASVVMWVDERGEARYSAAVALHSVTFSMSMAACRKHNGGDGANCKAVYDAKTPALAVVKASDGGYFFANGESRSEARKKGMAACETRANVTCKVDNAYGAKGLLEF
jgi:hypothetical protein